MATPTDTKTTTKVIDFISVLYIVAFQFSCYFRNVISLHEYYYSILDHLIKILVHITWFARAFP